jgi:hypothetical protein
VPIPVDELGWGEECSLVAKQHQWIERFGGDDSMRGFEDPGEAHAVFALQPFKPAECLSESRQVMTV